jgi:hypothetical protein
MQGFDEHSSMSTGQKKESRWSAARKRSKKNGEQTNFTELASVSSGTHARE